MLPLEAVAADCSLQPVSCHVKQKASVFKRQEGHVSHWQSPDRTVCRPWWVGLFCKSFKNRPSWKISCCSNLVLRWDCGWWSVGDGPRPPKDHLGRPGRGEWSDPGTVGLDERSRNFHRAGFQLHQLLVLGVIHWYRVTPCSMQVFRPSVPNPGAAGPWPSVWGKNMKSQRLESRMLLWIFWVACCCHQNQPLRSCHRCSRCWKRTLAVAERQRSSAGLFTDVCTRHFACLLTSSAEVFTDEQAGGSFGVFIR